MWRGEGKKRLYVLLDSAEHDQQDVDVSESGLCRLLAASGRRSSESVCRQQDDSICWRKAFWNCDKLKGQCSWLCFDRWVTVICLPHLLAWLSKRVLATVYNHPLCNSTPRFHCTVIFTPRQWQIFPENQKQKKHTGFDWNLQGGTHQLQLCDVLLPPEVGPHGRDGWEAVVRVHHDVDEAVERGAEESWADAEQEETLVIDCGRCYIQMKSCKERFPTGVFINFSA